jgi:hypothetical protein
MEQKPKGHSCVAEIASYLWQKRGNILFVFLLTNNGTNFFNSSIYLTTQNKVITIFIPQILALILL